MHKTFINQNKFYEKQTCNTQTIEDYKQLYFQAMSKIRQLSSIQNLLHGTIKTVSNIEIKDIVSQHQKNIMILQKQLISKDKLYANLQNEIKKEKQAFSEKEDNLKQKIQVQIRKKNVVIDQLDLVKGQLRICKKEMQNVKMQNQKLRKIVEGFTQNQRQEKQTNLSQSQQSERFNNCKVLIKKQQKEIGNLQNEIHNLKEKNQQLANGMDKLKEQMKSLTQIHEMQTQSKLHIIKNLQKDLKNKSKRIKELQTIFKTKDQQKMKENHIKNNDSLQKTINDKEKLILRLNNKVSQYQQLLNLYEQNEKQIYQQLIKKDVQIQEFQEKQKQYVKKIHKLQQIVDQLKCSYIHAQLQKDHLIQKHKKQQKSLKASRLSNISTTKFNQTLNNTTVCDNSSSSSSTLTPCSSLNNSRIIKIANDIKVMEDFDQFSQQQKQKQNVLKSKKGNLTTKNKLNQIKGSFYKNKTPKTINSRRCSQVTSFEI